MRMLGARVRLANLSVAKLLDVTDPFYFTAEWKQTRKRILARDDNTCVIPGCGRRAIVCDHIVSRRDGGSDDDANLRSLCRLHDNRLKENHLGERRGQRQK
jgi:5-methylcytosine-specific restriction endonuclease McrA